jgi:aminomethyltransferase
MNRTPLYDLHLKHRGMIADYGEWELPARFAPLEKERDAAINTVALFDNSAAGKFSIRGSNSENFLRSLIPTSLDHCKTGSTIRSCLCNEQGIIIDMIDVYYPAKNEFIISGSFNSTEKDFRWISGRYAGEVSIENVSDTISKIECIGPMSSHLISEIFNTCNTEKFGIKKICQTMYRSRPCFIAKTDFTGIPSCQIFIHNDSAPELWEDLLNTGYHYGIVPAGMDVIQLLTLEKSFPIQGFELREQITPVEANLFNVTGSNDYYPGRTIIESQLKHGTERVLAVISCQGKGTVHAGIPLFIGTNEAGKIIRAGRSAENGTMIASVIMNRKYADIKMTYYIGKPGSQMCGTIKLPETLAAAC